MSLFPAEEVLFQTREFDRGGLKKRGRRRGQAFSLGRRHARPVAISQWLPTRLGLRTSPISGPASAFAYMAVVTDLHSRRLIGWPMQSRQSTDVVLQALLMARWSRKPKSEVLTHSGQASKFSSMGRASFL